MRTLNIKGAERLEHKGEQEFSDLNARRQAICMGGRPRRWWEEGTRGGGGP